MMIFDTLVYLSKPDSGNICVNSLWEYDIVLCMSDLSLVISLNGASGTNAQLSYEHALTMQSPPTSFDVESCLELIYTAQSHFYVKLVCVTYSGTYNERLLQSSRQPLGFTSHKLKLALPATVSDYRNCSLAFQVKTVTTGVAAVISNIVVFPGQCPPAR